MSRNGTAIVGNSEYGQTLSLKFGDMMGAGFTVLPNILLKYQADLEITGNELNFIAQVWYHWWSDKDAYPAIKTIAKRMGAKDDETIRRYSRSLQKKGHLIVRDRISQGKGQLSSEYDFSPLIQRLNSLYLAEEAAKAEGPSDWVVLERQATPLRKNEEGGYRKNEEGPSAKTRTEEDKENKTHLEEDKTQYSNSFELQSQKSSESPTFGNSKKQFEFLENGDSEQGAAGDEPEEQGRGEYQPHPPTTNGFTAIGDVGRLKEIRTDRKPSPRKPKIASGTDSKARAGNRRGRGKSDLPEPPEWLVEHITRYSGELHDADHVDSNISQAYNLFLFTGAERNKFTDRLSEAKRRLGTRDIEKPAAGEMGELFGQRNKMPYFFKVLRDLYGLKDIPASQTKPKVSRGKRRGQNVNEQFYSP